MLWLVGGSDKLVCRALRPLQWSPWWLGGICPRPILVGVQPGSHLALIDTFSERDPVADNHLYGGHGPCLRPQAQGTMPGPFLKIYLWPSTPPLALRTGKG